jgi:hypothetical protein
MPAMRPRAQFLEFFAANVRNKKTRMADYQAVHQLFARRNRHRIGGIADVEPSHVAAYIENLAAIRMLFDWLVTSPGCCSQSCTHSARSKACRERRRDHNADRGTGPRAPR